MLVASASLTFQRNSYHDDNSDVAEGLFEIKMRLEEIIAAANSKNFDFDVRVAAFESLLRLSSSVTPKNLEQPKIWFSSLSIDEKLSLPLPLYCTAKSLLE